MTESLSVKRDISLSGILGLVLGLLIFLASIWVRSLIPALLPGFILALVTFVVLLLIALVEMPMMVFALRKMAQSTTPRLMISSGFALYAMFAAVYAAIFILLTDAGYFYFGATLAALGIARLVSGIWIK
jgi:hypothetical protein